MRKYIVLLLLCFPALSYSQVTTLIGKTANQLSGSVQDLVTELDAAYFNGFGQNDLYLRNAILERGISVSDYSTLAAAINAAESDSNFVVVAAASTITATDTVRAHAGLIFTGGGDSRVTISSGVTLYVNGAFWAPPNRRVFYGAGTVIFGPGVLSKVYPEWWGAKADSTTDSGTAFKSAYTAAPTGAKIELLSGGRTLSAAKGYIINTTVRVPSDKNTVLEGNGAVIYSSATDTVFLIQNGSQSSLPSYAINPTTSQPRHVFNGIRFKRITGYTGLGVAIALINSTGQAFNDIDVADYNNAFVFHNISDGWCENNEIFNSRIAGCDTAISYMLSQSGNNSMATNSLRKVTITRFTDSDVINQGAGQAVGIFSDTGTNLYRNVWDQVVIFPKDSVTCVNIDGKAEDLTGTINFEFIGSTPTSRMRGFHFGANSSELRFKLHMNLTGRIYFPTGLIFYSQIPGSFGYSGITTTFDGNHNHGPEVVVDSSKFTPIYSIVRNNNRITKSSPGDSARIFFANVNNSADGKLDLRARRNAPIEIRSITDNVYSAATANSIGGSALPLQPVRLLDIGGNRSTLNDSTTVDVRNVTHLIMSSNSANMDSLKAFKGGIAGQSLTVTFASSNILLANLVGGTGTGRIYRLDNISGPVQQGMKSFFKCESETGGVFWREMWRSAEYGVTENYTSTTVDSIDAAQVNFIRLNMSGAGNLRNFYNGIDGQRIEVLHRTANTTMLHLGKGTSKGLSLIGSANLTGSSGLRQTFVYDASDDLWREVSRSTNTSSGGSGWDDTGINVKLETTTDNVTIGDNTNAGKLTIDGDGDEIQLYVKGHSTQTNDYMRFVNNAGTTVFNFSPDASNSFAMPVTGNIALGSAGVQGSPTNAITLTNGTAPTGTPSTSFVLYSTGGEAAVRDDDGNVSKLTHAWGALYMSDATQVISTSATPGTWIKVTGFSVDSSPAAQGMTVVADSITVLNAGTYEISVNMSFTGGTASTDNYKIVVAKNAAASTKNQAATTTIDASSRVSMSLSGFYTAAANDVFSLWMTNNTDGDDPTIVQCQFTIKRIN